MSALRDERCNDELHEKFGGACYYCCDRCNYGHHRCHFCGDELRHDSTDWVDPHPLHGCYAECEECGHIGHEHFSNSCRGGEYELDRTVETDCSCTVFRQAEAA